MYESVYMILMNWRLGYIEKRGLAFTNPLFCGRLRIRTADPLLVRQML